MRTQKQIAARVKTLIKEDPLGFETSDLLSCLDYEFASEFLDDSVTEREWNKKYGYKNANPEEVKKQLVEYLPFAWEKAINHRGLSANRSVGHIKQWLWLLNDEDTLAYAVQESSYKNYGAPILKEVSEKYGYKWPKTNKTALRMSDGQLCETCESEGFGGCAK